MHVGLGGADDEAVFAHAFQRDQVVVTLNVGDFMRLAAAAELHPGVIALRQASLNAEQQWSRIQLALRYCEQIDAQDLINCVLEVQEDGEMILHLIPAA